MAVLRGLALEAMGRLGERAATETCCCWRAGEEGEEEEEEGEEGEGEGGDKWGAVSTEGGPEPEIGVVTGIVWRE